MIFSRDYIGYLARRTVKHLIDAKMITTSDLKAVEARVNGGADRRTFPRRPHQRGGARHSRSLLRGDAQVRRPVRRDVQEGQDRAGQEIQGGAMRINPDKLNKLAHTVADTLAEIDQVGFLEDRNTIRQEARKALDHPAPRRPASTRPPASKSPTSARSSWKARRSGRSSTASTTTTKCASWGSERKPSYVLSRTFILRQILPSKRVAGISKRCLHVCSDIVETAFRRRV